ncbi:peroxide stress protein YaaA, partial [Francisella tularensis]|uniref:peroxide stress protein YaaA n=1 Tax=Francisella tularensis TaxID=263 RepID=UPI00238198F1
MYCLDIITSHFNEYFSQKQNNFLINLASYEYSLAIVNKSLAVKCLVIDFNENIAGAYKSIGINAKKARG